MGPLAIGALAIGAARAFGRHGNKINWGELNDYANSLRPSGYTSYEDTQSANALRSRLSGVATETGANLRMEALRRLRQRNIDIAPASEATLSRIADTEAAGREHAGDAAEEYLGNIRLGNQRFEQQKALELLSGRIRSAGVDQSRQDLRDSTFYNSLLQITPSIIGNLSKLSAGAGAAMDPSMIGDYPQTDYVGADLG